MAQIAEKTSLVLPPSGWKTGKKRVDPDREMADKNSVNRKLNLDLLLETLLLRGAAVGF